MPNDTSWGNIIPFYSFITLGFVLIIHGDINLLGGFENPFYLIQFCLCSEAKDIEYLFPTE